MNDPGTAINVMAIMMSLLLNDTETEQEKAEYDRLSIRPLDCKELIRDGFAPISRDGAGILEVNLVMQKVLAGIWRNVPEKEIAEAALTMASQSLERAKQTIAFEPEVALLTEKHQTLFKSC